MSTWEDRLGILAEEAIFGKDAGAVPLQQRASDPRLKAEKERLLARFRAIKADRVVGAPSGDPALLDSTVFRQLRDETLPGWSSTLLAVDPEDLLHSEGVRLFSQVRFALERHYKFERPWHSAIAALFVFQAWLASLLPVVFYLIVKGKFGGGKTSLLIAVSKLGGGVVFENVSVAALARELNDGRLVCIDEYDVRRPPEIQLVMDSLVRQGYRRNAAPYTRFDASQKKNEHLPVYGPKALTIRKFLDPALEDRGFLISASPVAGEEAYSFVVQNLWSDFGDLPARVERWAQGAKRCYPDDRLRAIASLSGFRARVQGVLETTGANRGTELILVSLLVSEIIGIKLEAELKAASELRRVSSGAENATDLEDLEEVVLAQVGTLQANLMKDGPKARIWHRELKAGVDAKRKARGDRAITDARLSEMITELGVSESWKVRPKNRVGYDLPLEFVRQLEGEGANLPNHPNPPDGDGGVREVRPVRDSSPGAGPVQETLYLSNTKADKVRGEVGDDRR